MNLKGSNSFELLLEISKHAASETDPNEFLERAVTAILRHTESDEISITLSDPGSGRSFQAKGEAKPSQTETRALLVLLSRDVVVRRVRYGHFELKSSNPALHRGEFIQVFDCVSEQLARFAELHAERERSERLREQIDEFSSAVRRSKVVARASNFFNTARSAATRVMMPSAPIPHGQHWRRPTIAGRRAIA